jgi:xylulokinase
MKQSILIGLDIGTTNIKAAAYFENGKLIAEASHRYPIWYPQQGWVEQDPKDWERSSIAALTSVFQQLGSDSRLVAGLALSTHAPGFVPLDKNHRVLLERVPIWQDERSLVQAEALLEEIGTDWVGLGTPMASFAAKLRWFSESHLDLVQSARYALGVKSYMTYWLTGKFATDPSSEPGDEVREERICTACGWSPEQFAPVYPATTVIGELRQELVDEMGLKNRIPVVLGLNDGASATLANGALSVGEAVISLGTNGVVFLVSDSPIPSAERFEKALFCWPYLEGRWIAGGQTKTGACSLDWIASILKDPSVDIDIDTLLEEASETPMGSGGVIFLPYLMGSGTPNDDPAVSGAVLGLTMRQTRGDLIRAVLEGVAFTLRDVQKELQGYGLSIDELWITGGGARSKLWRDIMAQVLNRTLKYTKVDSSLGAAMLASVGVGIHGDIDTARQLMTPKPMINQVDRQMVEVYDRIYREFTKMRDFILGLS